MRGGEVVPGARLKSGVPAVVGHQPVAVTQRARRLRRGFAAVLVRPGLRRRGVRDQAAARAPRRRAPPGRRRARDGRATASPASRARTATSSEEPADARRAGARHAPEVRRRNAGVHRPAGGRDVRVPARLDRGEPRIVLPRRGSARAAADPGSIEAVLRRQGHVPPAGSNLAQCACDDGRQHRARGCASRRRARRDVPGVAGRGAFDAASGSMACVPRRVRDTGVQHVRVHERRDVRRRHRACECPPGFAGVVRDGGACRRRRPRRVAPERRLQRRAAALRARRRVRGRAVRRGVRRGRRLQRPRCLRRGGGGGGRVHHRVRVRAFRGTLAGSADGFVDYPHCAAVRRGGERVVLRQLGSHGVPRGRDAHAGRRKCQKVRADARGARIDLASYADFGIGDHNECRNPTSDALPWCTWTATRTSASPSRPAPRRAHLGLLRRGGLLAMDGPPHSPRNEAQCSVAR